MSGLKINFDKSEVIIISQDERKTLRYAELFNCSTGQWPLKYLGVPVCGSRLHIKDWLQLDEKLHKKIGGMEGELFILWWQVDPAECLPQQHSNLQYIYVLVAKNNHPNPG